jgi:lipopolysaccharide heptosyltransferase II
VKRETKKILVIRFSSLGDVILTTPLPKALQKTFQGSQIDYCVKSSYADVLRFNPNINRLIIVDDSLSFSKLKELRNALRANSYDLIIDAHNNLRTFYLKMFLMLKGNVASVKKYSIRKFLLVKFKINLMKDLPTIIQRYLSVLKKINTNNKYQLPEIFTNEQSFVAAEQILKDLELPRDSALICIIPSAKHFTKTYPPEYFAELINKFDRNRFSFLLAGKGNDKKNIDIIKKSTGSNVYDLCDKLSLLQLTEVIRKCKLVIACDTGPMHIAEALNIPLIMIAGSSVKEFGFFPASENSQVIENEGLKCRPCSHIGRDECPLGHFKCMREIKPELIYLMLQHKFLYS